jgi:hypothetical protein
MTGKEPSLVGREETQAARATGGLRPAVAAQGPGDVYTGLVISPGS